MEFGSVQENNPSGRHIPAHRQLPDLHKGSSITASSFSLKMETPMFADMSRNIHFLTLSPTLNNLQHLLSVMFIYFVADWRYVNVTPQDWRCILVNCLWQYHWGQGRTEETTHISRFYHLKYQLLLWPVVPLYSPEKNLILLYLLVTLIIIIKQSVCLWYTYNLAIWTD